MTDDTAKETLPTLDLRRFDAEGDERGRFLRELRDAARTYGFFYLVGHGVDDSLIQSVLSLSRRFFALPESQKLEIEMVNSPHFRGYNRAGFEYTRGKQDWREQIDIGAERPALPRDPAAPAWTRLQVRTSGRLRCLNSSPCCSTIRRRRRRWRPGCCRPFRPRWNSPKTCSNRSTSRRRTSSSRSCVIPDAGREKAIRGWARTKIPGLWRSSSRTGSRVFRSRARTAGSTRRPSPDRLSSTLEKFSKSRPAVISAPTCIAS